MTEAEAFAAIALAAVACDGVLGREEAHALRKQLEFRFPYRERSESDMGALFDQLLGLLRSDGVEGLLKQALPALSPLQQETALALASQLVHADRQVSSEEDAFLKDLTSRLNISEDKAKMIVYSISALNRDSLAC